MFVFLSALAAISYALQTTLLTPLYRDFGAFVTVAIRGVALGISMAPLLLWVSAADCSALIPLLPAIALASTLTIIGNWAGARVFAFLPVGLGSAISITLFALATLLIGLTTLDEHLQTAQLVAVAVMLAAVFLSGLTDSSADENRVFDVPRGVWFSLIFAVLLGASFVIIGWASRQTHPFLVGYVWELGAGVIGIGMLMSRKALPSLSKLTLCQILVRSSPTVLGTGCYTYAATRGPVGLVATILTLEIPACSLFAAAIFRERMNRAQWALVFVMTAAVMVLKALS